MASADDHSSTGNDFIKVMKTFPCLFNVGMIKTPSRNRLSLMIKALENDIEKEEEGFEGQRIQELNVLSWIHFQIGDLDKAKAENDDALCIDTDDLVTLGNRAFLEWYSGSQLSTFLEHLEKLKLKSDFPEKRLNAKSVQANLLFRLGGICNMSSAIPMYNDLVNINPKNYEWKYSLCLARRRIVVMTRNHRDEEEIEELYRDIIDNASQAYLKSAAMCELATMLALKTESVREVEDLVQKARVLSEDSPVVLRKCGMALTMQSNPRGIDLLEKSKALKNNQATHHALAKALVNFRMTRNMNREDCDRKAALNFQSSYDLSLKENIRPLVDLAFMYLCRNRHNESLEICSRLIQNWFVREIYKNPFMLSKILESWYQSLKKTGGKRNDPHLDRHLSIAISVSLEQFKRSASPHDKSLIFDLIVSPGRGMCRDRSRYVLGLVRDCVDGHSAVQTLMRLKLQGNLGRQGCVEEEIELLLEKDQPGEALLVLDILKLQENSHQNLLRKLEDRAMLQEAKWQLNEGLISCKLLFYKLFNIRHSHSSLRKERESEDNDEASPGADVLIFQDGHHWKPFLQDNFDQSSSDEGSLGIVNQSRMVEDVLANLFDLETITNPLLPFSGKNRPDPEEFSVLLRYFKVRLVILVVDADTSNGFLQMADFLFSKSYEAKETDVAIVYTEDVEGTAKNQMTTLASRVRCFKANDRGFQHRTDSKPVSDLVGTEILDAYFSGNVDNAIDFFQFLAPSEL